MKVDREDVKASMFPFLKTPNSELSPLEITFESNGVEEKAIDLGGPSRELFTLLFEEFLQPSLGIFEGKGGFVLPVNNRKAITSQIFRAFGKSVVLSLCTDPHGPGFPYFPPFIVSYFIGREYTHEMSSIFVVNEFLKQFIDKVRTPFDFTYDSFKYLKLRFFVVIVLLVKPLFYPFICQF